MSEKTLLDRINESMERVGKMCSEGRPPRMSIPVNPDDDDTFINDTLRECRAALAPQPDHVSQGPTCAECGGRLWKTNPSAMNPHANYCSHFGEPPLKRPERVDVSQGSKPVIARLIREEFDNVMKVLDADDGKRWRDIDGLIAAMLRLETAIDHVEQAGVKSQPNSHLINTALEAVDELIHRGNGLERARHELWEFSHRLSELRAKADQRLTQQGDK